MAWVMAELRKNMTMKPEFRESSISDGRKIELPIPYSVWCRTSGIEHNASKEGKSLAKG
jgi:hypothetical protein